MTVGKLLQEYGTEVGRNLMLVDVWLDATEQDWINKGCPDGTIPDTRFPNEKSRLESKRMGGFTMLVDATERMSRKPVIITTSMLSNIITSDGRSTTHASETSLQGIPKSAWTCVVDNNGPEADLPPQVLSAFQTIVKQYIKDNEEWCGGDELLMDRAAWKRMEEAQKLTEVLMSVHEHSGHGYRHVVAVMNNARMALLSIVTPNKKASGEDIDVVPPVKAHEAILLGSLLHDLDDPKLFHRVEDAKDTSSSEKTTTTRSKYPNATRILTQIGVTDYTMNLTLEMIDLVSCSKNGNTVVAPRWKLIVRDCDRVEALGLDGIHRTMDYSNSIGMPFHTPLTERVTDLRVLSHVASPQRFAKYAGKSESMIDHFYDKLLHIGSLQSGNTYLKSLAGERMTMMRYFVLFYGSGILEKYGKWYAANATSSVATTLLSTTTLPPTIPKILAVSDAEMTLAKLIATAGLAEDHKPYVAPVTGKSMIALFDEMMTLPEDERPGLNHNYVLALEGQICFFWTSTVTGLKVTDSLRCDDDIWSRHAVAGIVIIDVNPELQRHGVFTRLLQHMADHKEVAHVAIVDAHTDNIQGCLNKITVNGHRFHVTGTDYTWCSKGGCEHGNDKPMT